MHERSESALWSGARLWSLGPAHPLMAESWHHPRTLKHRLLVRDPRARGPRGCPDGADKQTETRAAPRYTGDLVGRARGRPGCVDEVSDALLEVPGPLCQKPPSSRALPGVTTIACSRLVWVNAFELCWVG